MSYSTFFSFEEHTEASRFYDPDDMFDSVFIAPQCKIQQSDIETVSDSDSSYDSIRKKITKPQSRQQKMWSEQEDQILLDQYEKCNHKWNEIAKFIPGRNASQCSQRYRRLFPIKPTRKQWTEEEDQRLMNLVQTMGRQWMKISKEFPNVSGRQVRERYINKLDADIIKEPFTKEEDEIILKTYLEHGPKWALIANMMKGRPENFVKNRFYSYIRRVYLGQQNPYQIVHNF